MSTIREDYNESVRRISWFMYVDPKCAWAWHCVIAMAAQDEGVSHEVANRIAKRLMKSFFDVNTGTHPEHPTFEGDSRVCEENPTDGVRIECLTGDHHE